MAYQIQRKAKLQESLELLDENGAVAHTVTVDLDLDKVAQEFNQRYNAAIRAERTLKDLPTLDGVVEMTEEQANKANDAITALGTAIVEIIQLVFGDSGAEVIFSFYDHKYMELCTDILPFIVNVVAPAFKKQVETRQKQLAENYNLKQKQKRRFGVI